MTTQLDDFETRLLQTLRAEVARPQPRFRRGYLLAAAAAAAATAFVVVPAVQPSPAFSVGEGNAGEITVEITRPEDAAGLERALAEHGINADITYLRDLQTCAPGRYLETARSASGLGTSIGERSIAVTIPPGAVQDGETFVLVWSVVPLTEDEIQDRNAGHPDGITTVSGAHTHVDFAVASGPVGPCQPMPAPGGAADREGRG